MLDLRNCDITDAGAAALLAAVPRSPARTFIRRPRQRRHLVGPPVDAETFSPEFVPGICGPVVGINELVWCTPLSATRAACVSGPALHTLRLSDNTAISPALYADLLAAVARCAGERDAPAMGGPRPLPAAGPLPTSD